MVVPLRSQARLRLSLLHWAYFALFRAQRARFVRPRRTRRRGRLKRERASFHNSQWSSCIFAPALNSAWSYHCARKLACGTPCFIGLTPRCFAHSARASCAPRLRLRGVPCLRTSCARHFSPSGLHLFASICIHSSQSSICIARKLACSSRCSLGSLRPVSATGGGLRAPRKKCQK